MLIEVVLNINYSGISDVLRGWVNPSLQSRGDFDNVVDEVATCRHRGISALELCDNKLS